MFRYLLQNMDWLEEELGGFDDDYLIFDCPGMLVLFFESLVSYNCRCRPDRTLYTPSVPTYTSPESDKNGHPSVCYISDRIAVHGRSL